jgi:hypothetical protein
MRGERVGSAAGLAAAWQVSARCGAHLSHCLPGWRQLAVRGAIPRWDLAGAAEVVLNQLTMMVTAGGRWVLPDSEEFLAALGDPDPDYDAVGFAVRNLGFVKFQVLDRLVTEIELHPRNVDLRALLAVEELIAQSATNLFRLKYLDTEWHSEISASAEHTMARLRELCAPVFEPRTTERFRVEPRDPTALFDNRSHRIDGFYPMAMKWRVAFGNFDPVVMGLATRGDMMPHFAIAGFRPSDGLPTFRFLGSAQRWGGDSYRVDGLGNPIEDMPDREYGAWVSEFYKSVGDSGQPRYDLVTADMQYHGEAGTPRRQVRYERLLLPWRTP